MSENCENCKCEQLESFIDRPGHTLKRCPRCHLFQKGQLESTLVYEDNYHDGYEQRMSGKVVTAKVRLGAASHHLDGIDKPVCLDIGCSIGATVKAAKELGWQAMGVDVSSTAIDVCKQQGLDCQIVESLDLPFGDNTFDLVTHWHVIEHVEDIHSALMQWKRVLKPGGVMMFETPNSDFVKAKLLGQRYKKFWPAEHLYTFNRKNMSSLLQNCGFELLPTRLTGPAHAHSYYLYGYALAYRGFREVCRTARMCKSFEITCQKPHHKSSSLTRNVA